MLKSHPNDELDLGLKAEAFIVQGFTGALPTVKPRKLEHHSPPALKVKYKGS